jgi:amino acid adenylation domain-containing protein
VLVDWNATATRFPSGRALHRLVETQVERTPDSVALVAGDTTATYRELNHRANQVAHHLRKLGVGPDVLVGICMERSAAMAVGLLAVLKAGGAYVPLDPAYPAHRLSFMLANSQASILLTQSHLKPGLAHLPSQILCLDGDRERLSQESAENLSMDPAGEGLAYVIYTSGSTGVPKGAMVPHRAICNHMQWMQAEFPLSESDAVLQRTPFSFDASVWEFYAPLMAGARLVMAPPAQFQHAGQLAATIQKHGVTVLQVVPSLLGLLLEEAEFLACRSLRRVFCGGEALPQALVQRFHEHFQAELVNLYGPTEAAIDATFSRCAAGGDGSTASIGRPIANLQAYILDSRQQPAPVGVAGELCLGGAGVGRGYLRRPALTARRFIPNPFNTGDTSRLYRTGDLARFRPDGSIAFLGRIDQQVKLRGFRIEPGEIEATLRQHSSVQDTVVTMRPDGSDSAWLAAYVVARQDRPASVADLRGFLRSRLPAYMVPAHFVFLDGLPLLPNGKVDRTALPAPEGLYPAAPSGYVAPKSELESTIGRVWQSILQLQKVGVDDNFFDLGGHSLLMVRVQNQLQDLIGREIPLLDLFRFPTIRTFANYLRHDGASSDSDAIQEARERAQRQREAMAGRQRRRTRSA